MPGHGSPGLATGLRIADFDTRAELAVAARAVVRQVVTLIGRLVAGIRGAGDTVVAVWWCAGWQSFVTLQVSTPLQYWPSLQTALLAVWVQLSLASSHASTVQETPSLQFGGVPGWQSL